MCFQNHALDYFYNSGLSVDLSNIRSVHMHYQFFLPRGGKKLLFSQNFQLYRCGVRLAKISLYFPRLEKLHFCVAGPICIRSRTYDWIKDSITRICEQLEYLGRRDREPCGRSHETELFNLAQVKASRPKIGTCRLDRALLLARLSG